MTRPGPLCLGVLLIGLSPACSRPPPADLPPPPVVGEVEIQLPAVRAQFDAAFDELQRDPNDAGVNGHLGMLFQTYGNARAAAGFYARARMLDPDELRWTYYHGQMLEALGDLDGAIHALARAAGQRNADPSVQITYANALQKFGQTDRALTILESLSGAYPDRADAAYAYGTALVQNGEHEKGAVHLRRSIDKGGPSGAAYYALALASRQADDHDAAEKYMALFQRHRLASPPGDDPFAAAILALNRGDAPFVNRGNMLLETGDYAAAIGAFEQAIAINPDNAAAHATLIGIFALTGDFARAEQHFERAVAIDPNRPKAYFNLGVLRHWQQRFAAAIAALARAADLDPFDPAVHTQLGLTSTAAHQPDAAIAHYQDALAVAPDYPDAVTNLATLLILSRRFDDALAILARVEASPEFAPAIQLRLVALARENLGQLEAATTAIEQAHNNVDSAGQARLANDIARDRARIRRRAGGEQ